MVAFRARRSAQERPYTLLEEEMTEEQAEILAPTIQDLSVQSILKDAGVAGATKKSWRSASLTTPAPSPMITGRRTTQSGSKKLLAAVQLAASLAEFSALTKATKEQGKCKADTELIDLAPRW